MKKCYEKPEINVTEFCLNQAVANTCWGLTADHVHQKTRYYDVKGEGIVSFNVKNASGNCGAPDAYNIQYITVDAAGMKHYSDGSAYEKELEDALKSKGGNNGQPYGGIDADFPAAPVPDSK